MHRAHQVHVEHQLEVGQFHLGKALVAQDAGVVDQDVDPAPGVDSLLHHCLHRDKIRDGGAIGQRLAASRNDLVHDGLGTTEVVDQHLGTTRCQRQRMLLAQAAAGASNDGHAAGEIESH